MKLLSLAEELRSNSYPGRGIVIGRSKDGAKAVTAYFIMGRSENSRNRVFVEEGEGDPHPGLRSGKAFRSQPYHLCAGPCPGQ